MGGGSGEGSLEFTSTFALKLISVSIVDVRMMATIFIIT